MENIFNAAEEDNESEPTFNIKLGLVPFDEYNTSIKKFSNTPNYLIEMFSSSKFRMKFQMEAQASMISNSYLLSFKHNNKSILQCSKQLFGKYIFYSKNQQETIEEGYMSKYDNEYKLYIKKDNDKVELAYFIFNPKDSKDKQKMKILIPNQNISSVQGIRSNAKKQSEIKWRWYSKSQAITALNIDTMVGNLLKLKYIYVSKGDTLNDPKMIIRETDSKVWEYFVENPLSIIQGFALAVLMAENVYA